MKVTLTLRQGPVLSPWLSLAEFLGRLAELTLRSQYLIGGALSRVDLTCTVIVPQGIG